MKNRLPRVAFLLYQGITMAISIYSPNWDGYDSYGIIANTLADYAAQCDHVNRLGMENVPDGVALVPSFGGLMLGYPTLFKKYGALARMGRRVAVTMFESTVLPEGWVENLNSCHAVIVPVSWVCEVFRENGVTVPIHVVPLGINPVYLQVQRSYRRDRPYTFLALGDRATRKGWDLAWHAFRSAFGNRSDVKLIIKCRANGLEHINSGDENVEILREDLTHEEMAALYARCDCMVFPTRGEGFGLPPREFAATGGVVLTTRFAGTAEHLDQWGYGIPYELVPAWDGYNEKLQGCGEWAEPDVEVLTRQMRAIYQEEDSAFCSARFKKSAIPLLYDWNDFARRVFEIYRGE